MSSRLLVKNFPPQFSEEEKCEFLQLFGGLNVICMYGKLKNCCYVEFPDLLTSKQAIETLHQFDVLGQRLVAEYAKPANEELANQVQSKRILEKTIFSSGSIKSAKDNVTNDNELDPSVTSTGISSKLGVNHEFPDHLHYKYPEPNILILTNIANALATVPKFYTLVLHLMNKLNLPPPFTGVTPTPPIPGDSILLQDASVDTSDLHEYGSSEESELESDSEIQKHEIYKKNQIVSEPVRKRKRLRALAKTDQEKLNTLKQKSAEIPVESAFELGSSTKRLEFKLGASIKEAVEKRNQPPVHYSIFDERGVFGKIDPVQKEQTMSESEEEEEELDVDSEEYISAKELHDNKVSQVDILAMNQFKNYKEGNKTNRLYIKNIGKQVVEDDLKFIFKRFLQNCSNEEKAMLDIRLMQEGRMKGQAFVTFPNENIAEKALKAVHGYILQNKPLVIQYGRSGK